MLAAPLTPQGMKLLVGELKCLVGVSRLACRACLAVQGGGDAFAPAGQLQVALVGEHDGLRAATSADHDRLGVNAGLTEVLQERRQLSACLAG